VAFLNTNFIFGNFKWFDSGWKKLGLFSWWSISIILYFFKFPWSMLQSWSTMSIYIWNWFSLLQWCKCNSFKSFEDLKVLKWNFKTYTSSGSSINNDLSICTTLYCKTSLGIGPCLSAGNNVVGKILSHFLHIHLND
jgi:hypothetical protein